jgi:hypothetical protein
LRIIVARAKLRQRRARIGQLINQRKAIARRVFQIAHGYTIVKRLTRRYRAWQLARYRVTPALQPRAGSSHQ